MTAAAGGGEERPGSPPRKEGTSSPEEPQAPDSPEHDSPSSEGNASEEGGDSSAPATPPTEAAGSSARGPGPPRLRFHRLWVAAGVFLLLFLATIPLWWTGQPERPSERLRANAPEATATPGLPQDLEQLAFRERQRRRTELKPESSQDDGGAAAVTLTDRGLVDRLRGRWTFELGPRRISAEFGARVVERVKRGALLVELFPVDGDSLPPFFTTLKLPERGTFLVFSGQQGDYELVLEDLQSHGRDLLSFRLGDSHRRFRAWRIGESPPGLSSEAEEREAQDAEDRPRSSESLITLEAPPPATDMWRRAQELRSQGKLHSLEAHLKRMGRLHPRHSGARRWSRRVGRWIDEQERDLTRQVLRRLDELAEAIEDRDLEEIRECWGSRPDAVTLDFFSRLLNRRQRLRTRIQLHSVDVVDGVAELHTTVTIEVSGDGRVDIEAYPWRGTLRGGRFASPFP